jgi:hypothetical protein
LIKFLLHSVFLAWLCCCSFQGEAADVISIKHGSSSLDLRGQYIESLMVRALRISQEKYGPFTINRLQVEIPSQGVLHALQQGNLINVSVAMTSDEWESKVIPIRIPVRRGIFKYRLLLVHKDNLERYQSITDVKQLKELPVGLKRGWTIRTILDSLDFNIVEADSYDRIFEMLHNKRFAYTIRGIHEAYDELRLRKRFFDDLVIEPDILLVESGELKQLFEDAFSKYINILDLKNRRVIDVGNPLLPEKTPLDREELWFDFNISGS